MTSFSNFFLALATCAALGAAAPAFADSQHYGSGYRHWHHHHRGAVVYVPAPYDYIAPRVVYVQRQAYYAQPPVYAPRASGSVIARTFRR